jgi:cholesterol oxidase
MSGTLHRPGAPGTAIDGSCVVTIETGDMDRLIDEADHEASLSGTVSIPALSRQPMTIEHGHWNLFTTAEDRADTRAMVYHAPLTDVEGKPWLLTGRKLVHGDSGFDLWRDTTTLLVELFEGHAASDSPTYEGRFTIAPADFVRQLGTMAATGAGSAVDKAKTLGRFGGYLAGPLFNTYAGAFAKPSLLDPHEMRIVRPLRTELPETHFFDTKDGKKLRLLRYQGGTKGPLVFAHGLGISSRIFSIDTIETNLLEFFYAAGFDCWLLDFRASIELPYARERFTADDVALRDYPAAVAFVRDKTRAASVQFLGHCYGAMCLAMSILAGLKGVRSVVFSQLAAHADTPFFPQRLLAYLHGPGLMKLAGIRYVDACVTVDRQAPPAAMIDAGLALLYPFHRDDRTHSATSQRITELFGPLYQLDQLNQATLDALPEIFGITNIHIFQQLTRIARKGRVVTASGHDSYFTPANLHRFAIPALFVHGALNRAFAPSGTQKTLAALAAANGADFYDRVEIPDMGHIDCIFGKNAARDVYPHMLQHLLRTAQAVGAEVKVSHRAE